MTAGIAFGWAVVLALVAVGAALVAEWSRRAGLKPLWWAVCAILGGLALLLAGQAMIAGLVIAGALE